MASARWPLSSATAGRGAHGRPTAVGAAAARGPPSAPAAPEDRGAVPWSRSSKGGRRSAREGPAPSPRRMCGAIVLESAADYRHVRFGLGVVVEPNRALGAHHPPCAEHGLEHSRRLQDRRVAQSPLWLGDDQLAADQLDGFAGLEDAEGDELLVLDPGSAAGPGLGRRHGRHRIGRLHQRQCQSAHRYFPRDGYTTMKFDWLGIFTFGNVCAFISSFSPMIPLRLSRYAVTAYTSSSLSDCGWT